MNERLGAAPLTPGSLVLVALLVAVVVCWGWRSHRVSDTAAALHFGGASWTTAAEWAVPASGGADCFGLM